MLTTTDSFQARQRGASRSTVPPVIAPRRTVLVVATLVTAAAPSAFATPQDSSPIPPQPSNGERWVRPVHGCGTVQENRAQFAPPTETSSSLAAAAPRTIYLNRNGATYQVGSTPTNSAANTANRDILGFSGTVVIPPLLTGFNWANISTCVKTHFAPYNIRVVEVEPTSGQYIEAVVGGDGTEVGAGPNQLFGIASADNFCGVTETGIAFTFSEVHRNVPRKDEELCATIAHEVGHLLALEHETLAIDLMSYVLIADSGTKTFANQSVPCGTEPGMPRSCSCGGSNTNSGGRLTSFVGLRPTETVPPSITLVSPGDNAALTPTFEVVARATDDMAMEGVTVYLNGFDRGSDVEPDGDEYRIIVGGIDPGDYTLAVEATDQAGNVARAEVAVNIAVRPTGESCLAATDCVGGQCLNSSDGLFCSEACDPGNDTCPDGFTCQSDISFCAPDEGGCCSTGGSPTAPAFLVFAVGLMLVRRRRRAAR